MKGRVSPVTLMSPSQAAAGGEVAVSARTVLGGVVVAALVAAAYLLWFPLEYRHSLAIADVLRDGAYFIGVLAVALWARRDIPLLNVGLALLLVSLWAVLVCEFTREPRWAGSTMPAVLAIGGLVLMTLGIRNAARLRALAEAERQRAGEELARSHATLRAVVNGSPDAVWVKDLGGAYLLANAKAAEQLGVDAAALIGRRDSEILPPEHAERHASTDQQAVLGHHVRYEDSSPPDGSRRTFLVSKGLVRDELGEPFGILGVARDISDRKAVEERLAHQATHDALTGLPNRSAFLDRLARELVRAARQPRRSVAVLFLDLDNFKDVNDRFGHAAGDDLLVTLAGLLGQWVRPGDSVARFGGDEFIVLLQDVDGVGSAVQVAERVLEGLGSLVVTAHGAIGVTLSIGIALSRVDGDTPEHMIHAADTAMYRAKSGGGNRHSVYVAPLRDSEQRAQA